MKLFENRGEPDEGSGEGWKGPGEENFNEYQRTALLKIKNHFIDDCINGRFRLPDGSPRPPCSKEEALLRWKEYKPSFVQKLLDNPHWVNRFKYPTKWKGAGKETLDINPLQGQRELTYDDLIDMWHKAQAMPEPDRAKAIRQITQLSKEFESKAALFLANLLLETT